jgi:hypothetical protein
VLGNTGFSTAQAQAFASSSSSGGGLSQANAAAFAQAGGFGGNSQAVAQAAAEARSTGTPLRLEYPSSYPIYFVPGYWHEDYPVVASAAAEAFAEAKSSGKGSDANAVAVAIANAVTNRFPRYRGESLSIHQHAGFMNLSGLVLSRLRRESVHVWVCAAMTCHSCPLSERRHHMACVRSDEVVDMVNMDCKFSPLPASTALVPLTESRILPAVHRLQRQCLLFRQRHRSVQRQLGGCQRTSPGSGPGGESWGGRAWEGGVELMTDVCQHPGGVLQSVSHMPACTCRHVCMQLTIYAQCSMLTHSRACHILESVNRRRICPVQLTT